MFFSSSLLSKICAAAAPTFAMYTYTQVYSDIYVLLHALYKGSGFLRECYSIMTVKAIAACRHAGMQLLLLLSYTFLLASSSLLPAVVVADTTLVLALACIAQLLFC